MTGSNFETLLQSPLDDEAEPSGWGSVALGLVAAVAVVVGLSFVLGLWTTSQETPLEATSDTATTATTATAESAGSFPDEFSDIGGSVSMKPVAAISGGTEFIVSFATATAREADPEATPVPLGGKWQLESSGGSVTGATRLVYDWPHAAVFGVEFAEPPGDGDALRMTERWDADERTGSSDVPFTGTPFATTDAADIALGDDISLRLTQVDLGRHIGRILWTLSGPGEPTGVAAFDVEIVDQQGETVGSYVSAPSPRDPTRSAGIVDLFWDRGFDVHPDEGSLVRFTAAVQLVSRQSVDVVFDLATVPSG